MKKEYIKPEMIVVPLRNRRQLLAASPLLMKSVNTRWVQDTDDDIEIDEDIIGTDRRGR